MIAASMNKKSKKNLGQTLTEILISMLILSVSAVSVLASFSYAFKFFHRAGKKTEALNLTRKTQEAYRAIWMHDLNDSRLDITDTPVDATEVFSWLAPSYDGTIYATIETWSGDNYTKQIDVNVNWVGP